MRWTLTDKTLPRKSDVDVDSSQCDQIGQFIGLWTTFQSLWQKLICPNLLHAYAIFIKVSKSSEIIFGQFLKTFGDFLLVTLLTSYYNSAQWIRLMIYFEKGNFLNVQKQKKSKACLYLGSDQRWSCWRRSGPDRCWGSLPEFWFSSRLFCN